MTAAGSAVAARPPATVRRITLDADGTPLSALLALPEHTPPRATVVALHGAGMSAAYFHGTARPDTSFLALAADLGFAAVALDRPGYGLSARRLPEGQGVMEQATTIAAAVRDLTARHLPGAGVFLLAHSFGGKPALGIAADGLVPGLLGLAVSGCGDEYLVPPTATTGRAAQWRLNWGPLRLYPPGTFRASGAVVAPAPPRELADAGRWPETFRRIGGRIRVPVRFTFAEHEHWWRHDRRAVAQLRSRLHAAPRVLVDHQPDAGHNISLGWTARAYHLGVLGFVADCLRPDGDGKEHPA
ncbi:putative hydrolase [Streptomyces lincolnensis]|uniref:Putative hydrolase n=1 Tax=Streptomyces lincolnensis TaxID=1915 RepID=A0A1B1MKL0_STRLN|nr:alpha/beta fold hydrolase [Streptomyces lincolnensis]ANS69114.1 putative hydrolase [Streptomyces lincolnensis]AXG58033.1 putative hydrolase [Streptomyces lincolnensis]QMV10701.1 alpha/beta fold hydrolase [Streptomyces lincolnensis]